MTQKHQIKHHRLLGCKMIGVLLTARMGSTRLKQKHFKEIDGEPIFSFLIKRIREGFKNEIAEGNAKVIIVTGNEKDNKEFETIPEINVFYGSDNNIPLRHYQAAKHFGLKGVISIDGDDMLCSIRAMKDVYKKLNDGELLVKTEGLPLGMNIMSYNTSFLGKCLEGIDLDVLETGWGRIFPEDQWLKIPYEKNPNGEIFEQLRFTLDYDEDFEFFKNVILNFGDRINSVSDGDIINYVVDNKIYELNNCNVERYWENFSGQKEQEEENE